MSYTHLIHHERYQIQCWHAAGLCLREIAERLQRHPSTISRELRRNISASGTYYVDTAHRKASRRASRSRSHARITLELWACVDAHLRQDHSPEQVMGELCLHGLSISHTSIYRHIAQDRRRGGTLWRHRRHRRSYRHHPLAPRRFTPGRSIRERPEKGARVNYRLNSYGKSGGSASDTAFRGRPRARTVTGRLRVRASIALNWGLPRARSCCMCMRISRRSSSLMPRRSHSRWSAPRVAGSGAEPR